MYYGGSRYPMLRSILVPAYKFYGTLSSHRTVNPASKIREGSIKTGDASSRGPTKQKSLRPVKHCFQPVGSRRTIESFGVIFAGLVY